MADKELEGFFGDVAIEKATLRSGGNHVRPGEHTMCVHEFKPFESRNDRGKCVAAELDIVESKGKTEHLTHLGTEEKGFGVKVSAPHDDGERVSALFMDLDQKGQQPDLSRGNLLTICVAVKESLRKAAVQMPDAKITEKYAAMGIDIDTKALTGKELAAFCSPDQPFQGIKIKCSARTIKTKPGNPFTELLWQGCDQ